MPEFTVNGVTLHLPGALATPGVVEKLEAGTYEADEALAAERCVRPGFRVLELGAGLGYVTTICARRAGAENVLSVEANPAALEMVRENLARNGQDGVTLIHGAVTGRAVEGETAPFHVAPGFTGSGLRPSPGRRTIEVPLVPIHELVRAHRPHVVIMDIEGAEAELFDRPWSCPLRFLVLELHPKKYPPSVVKKIVDCMSGMNMTYDPAVSRGKVLGFRRVWGGGEDDRAAPETETAAQRLGRARGG